MFDTKSNFYENIHTHRFLADILSDCATRKPALFLDVLRSEVDDGGIDLILSEGKQTRHIQLKARAETIPPKPYQISNRLLETKGGAIIWIRYSKETLERIDFFVLIGGLNKPIPRTSPFEPAKNRKGKPRKGYSLVKMRQANHQRLNVKTLTQLLFLEKRTNKHTSG